MPGQRISKDTPAKELLSEWHAAQACGFTLKAWADEIGIPEGTLDTWLNKARRAAKESGDRDIKNGIGISDTGEANYREVVSVSDKIKTLEDLLATCRVDLDVWAVERYVVNKWPVGRKVASKHLTFTGGVIDGEITDTGGIFVEPLFQVKAWLIRKVPLAVEFVVQPVVVNLRRGLPKCPKRASVDVDGLQRALIIPDLQVGFSRDLATGRLTPFHDRAAMDVVLQVAQALQPDKVVYLGDLLDLAEWSDKFLRSPEFNSVTQPALIETAWWMQQFLLAAPEAAHHAIEGNHDLRAESAMVAHLAAAYQLKSVAYASTYPALSVPSLLGLDQMGVHWVGGYPDAAVWLNDSVRCVHGDIARSGAGDTASAMLQKWPMCSTIFGHIHRIEHVARSIYIRGNPLPITACSPGCLCRLDGVVPGHDLAQGWQQGFAVVTFDQGCYHTIEIVQVVEGRAAYGGRVFIARDRLGDLRADTQSTGWSF